MGKALAAAAIAAALLINSAVPTQAATPVAAGKKLVWDKGVSTILVKSTLSLSQVWAGSSVTLSLRD
jgi:preprotein translocase subunit SecG